MGHVVNLVLEQEQPDLVLYDAGVDPHADDSLGRLALTDQGLFRRDMMVRRSLFAQIPTQDMKPMPCPPLSSSS